ncbi:uncharacterized protein BDW43DRAFT_287967 [Aspergillus alliaceus]|uniref:uncharacterized protein n=1 Tax=Petromyces alliaceus TaxID=209559 RepID=UPI0012A4FAA2|nr:uncharacterized protein BDW43DRAFT_287967 [Aspergillus alliaceus]KAB8229612.1 hypothetical protein BDW43DRAFT_287967 [Aspergillus alliaceus]
MSLFNLDCFRRTCTPFLLHIHLYQVNKSRINISEVEIPFNSARDPTSMSPNYTHLNDKHKEIRLFHIMPDEERQNTLKGELRVVSLDDKPEFIALSCVWGDQIHRRKNPL